MLHTKKSIIDGVPCNAHLVGSLLACFTKVLLMVFHIMHTLWVLYLHVLHYMNIENLTFITLHQPKACTGVKFV